jgi:hypothetical protein
MCDRLRARRPLCNRISVEMLHLRHGYPLETSPAAPTLTRDNYARDQA